MSLFDNGQADGQRESLGIGAEILRGFARSCDAELWQGIQDVTAQAPFRHMITPGGHRMSVAMANCGPLGWITDRSGYRYGESDPESGLKWPVMPEAFFILARNAAAQAGFGEYVPDACLINRYAAGTKLSLHQDKDERDFSKPIVSVSLGLPAVFLFGGKNRADKPQRVAIEHGDVIVWGGPARLNYHGILPVKEGNHALTGPYRFNLTFRKAG